MNLLAFDTSTEYLSLALLKNGSLSTFDADVGQTHSQQILPQIQLLLDNAGLQLKDLQGIAFGTGPGSFTGVRIAAGVAQGLAFGARLPVVGICTLLALAEASGAEKVIACLDARMGEIYYAAYEKTNGSWQTVHEPMVCKPAAAPKIMADGWVGVGSGWQVYMPELTAIYQAQLLATQPQLLPVASTILRLAQPVFASGEAKPASEALPLYVRNRVALKTAEREQGARL